MCYDADAAPPRPGEPITAVRSARETLTAADGASVAAYLARPDPMDMGVGVGVLVLPDHRGLAGFYRQFAVQLAGHGHPALAIDYYGRTAGVGDLNRGDGFPVMEHATRLTRPDLEADIAAGARRLQQPDGRGCASIVAVGFCLGGRLAFFASAPRFGFAGVVGFYGAPGIAGPYGPGPTQHALDLAAPILALFGGADAGIPETEVTAFDAALSAAGVPHEIVTYPGASHGFFDGADGGSAEACADAWRRVLAFLANCGS